MLALKSVPLSLAVVLTLATSAVAGVKIGVVTSASGPIALVGIPQKNTVPLLPKTAGGETIEYISLDDASDPSATVTVFKKLVLEEKVDAIIGPSGSPNALGIIGFVAENGVAVLAPVGSASAVLPMDDKKKWIFKTTQNDGLVADLLVGQMVKTGVKTVGFIGTSDSYGDTWSKALQEAAKAKGLTVVAQERFTRQDTSLVAQGLKIVSKSPDAVLVGAPGSSSVLPETTLVDVGYKGKIYQTHGAALQDFLKLGGKKVEGTILAGSGMLVLDEIPDTNPAKKIAVDYIAGYEKLYGVKPATFGANVLDAGLLLENAIPAALKVGKPGTREFRAALRDALEATKELTGAQGVYNMTPEDHSGFDRRGLELLTVSGGQFHLLK
ncbi:MAG: ABC transporter substrate-binding protein [Ancalomicrobiaceae bacterium]|nr:ABC transporter substrate-binding protein [Ancalomicrobiaceae bacterium]